MDTSLKGTSAADPDESTQHKVAYLKRNEIPEVGRLTNKYNMTFHKTARHHHLSSLNISHRMSVTNDDESCSIPQAFGFFTPFPYRASLLLPVLNALPTPRDVLSGEDPANHAVTLKKIKNRSVCKKLNCIQHNTARKEKVVAETREALRKMDAAGEDEVTVPYIVAQIASVLQEDPEPDFDSNYNWLYSGGNLSHLSVGGENVLLAARGENCSSLRAIPVESAHQGMIGFDSLMSESASHDMTAHGTIFQITTGTHGDTGLVATRQRMRYSILSYSQGSLQEIFSCVAQHAPYTSIALSHWSPRQFCIATAQGLLKVGDLTKNTAQVICKRDKLCKNLKWSGLHYCRRNPQTVFYSREKYVEMIDFRDPSSKKEVFRVSNDDFGPCEVISMSENSNASCTLQYIGLSHHLITVDIRQPQKYLQAWTHLLQGPPQYIKIGQETTERELVCIGSTEEPHIMSVVNEWTDEDMIQFPISRCQPLCIGSLSTSLTQAKLQGLCLKPSIQSRFKLNLTGLTCLSDAIFCTTGAGDVFCQQVRPKFAEHDKEEEEKCMKTCLTEWQRQVVNEDLNCEVPILHLSEHLNVTDVVKAVFDKSTEQEAKKNIEPAVITWELSHAGLFCSRDIFAPKLLSAWNVNDATSWEAERAKTYGEDSKHPIVFEQKIERVQEWLSSNVLSGDQTQFSQSEDTFNALFSQNSQISTSQVYPASQISTSRTLHTNLDSQDVTLTQQSEVNIGSQDVAIIKRKGLSKYSKFKKRRTDGF